MPTSSTWYVLDLLGDLSYLIVLFKLRDMNYRRFGDEFGVGIRDNVAII